LFWATLKTQVEMRLASLADQHSAASSGRWR
jgi:hypothetical protein